MAGRSRSYLLLLLASVCSVTLAQQCEVGSLPVACFPTAEANFVAGLSPVASNTCGLDGPERVCYQVGAGGMVAGTCDFCDASVPELAHPAEHMTDPHSPDASNATFWQSQNYSVVQYPNSVVITFPFNKTYNIRRISLTFQSSRPESYAIYKSVDHGASFTPFHYFSLSCEATYGVDEGTAVEVGNEAVALCTSVEARLTPLSGGEAVFMPLEHRPSAAQFSSNLQLQQWVRATHLQLRLNRLNTFGDEILTSDPDVLDSYYYAISNVEVAGQCFCNGHASSCSEDEAGVLVCDCEHNTAGPDCGECRPFFQDRPWASASPDNPTACAPCNCNNHSTECHLDAGLYASSGMVSGGVCDECQHNTEGVNCERCRVGFYQNPNAPITSPDACLPCDCDPRGTEGGEASCISSVPGSSTTGQCTCRANVEGRQCNMCKDGYYGLDIDNPNGCSPCSCVAAGTVNSSQVCEKMDGQCDCKLGVGGRDCGQCLPGYYGLSPIREGGCLQCNCFIGGSVSQTCDVITGDCTCRSNIGGRVPNSEGREVLGCTTPLPGHYCHGLALVYEAEGEVVASPDVVQGVPSDLFTGSGFVRLPAGQSRTIGGVAVPFSGEYDLYLRYGLPGTTAPRVVVRLRAVTIPQSNSTAPCSPPTMDREETVVLSSNSSFSPIFTACLLAGGEYSVSLTALDTGVLVDSVVATPTLERGAGQLEVFQRQSTLEAYLASSCLLDHLLVGGASSLPDEDFCERVTCSATFQLFDGAVACGCDPVGSLSQSCDPYRGICPCRPGFSGRRCDLCTPGRGGSQCEACNCDITGSLTTTCDRGGQCVCKPGVGGLTCNTCQPGYYNLTDSGCEECRCDLVGSEGLECDNLGQCVCREGVTGEKCDRCAEGYSNLTSSGCSRCECDLAGSLPPRCDPLTGQCICRDNVLRPHCDRCNCSGNSDLCDLSTGICLNCERNTTGNSCEQCIPGYYGNPVETGCHPCPCPGTEPGSQFAATCEDVGGGEVRCVECREGHVGSNCESCVDGYVGDPTGEDTGSPLPCILCECNGNINPLSAETCHPATGVCLNCLNNTAGDHCEKCARGYHGDAITAKNCTLCPEGYYWLPDATCAPCGCHPNGSVEVECEDVTGRCECLPSVMGLKCDVCGDGFHRISEGCVACPACYDQVATEFNRTLLLYSDLLSRINSSMVTSGSLPADLLRDLMRYQALLTDLLERAINLTNRERVLTEDVASAAMETAELEGLLGRYDSNVSRAEAGLRGLLAEVNSTSELLQQLRAILTDLEQIIRVELQNSLALANSQLESARIAFEELVSLAGMANETSFAQLQLALSLLSDIQAASSDAAEALRLLCEAISLQNETTVAITSLEETQLPPLEAVFQEAEEALMAAEVEVPLALVQARRVLDLILSVSIPDYNTSSLQSRLQSLQDQKEILVSDTNTTSMELDRLEGEVSSLSDQARPLIAESQRLNLLAVELLARAHAALSFANRTVQEGNEFIAMVQDLLDELRRRLNDTRGFVEGLEEVIRNVELAEELSLQAEEEAREKEGEVREAVRLAAEAALVLEEASGIVQQALEVAVRVNEDATALLSDAHLLNSSSLQLAEGVAESGERLTEVERVAEEDREAIAMVTTTAQTVIVVARDLQRDIQQLMTVLDELDAELNRTELVPTSRLEGVGSEVEQLESQADENQVIIDGLQTQVRLLEESAAMLRERYVSLQQHRDLLQSILNNVQRLDCRSQFQSSN